MNAIAASGTDQASLLAAFTLPLANAAPPVPSTAAFLNIIHLILSPGDAPPLTSFAQDASNAAAVRPAANLRATASPAQIADAMIRSMLIPASPPGLTQGLTPANVTACTRMTASTAADESPDPAAPSIVTLATDTAPAIASRVNVAPLQEAIWTQAATAAAPPAAAAQTTAPEPDPERTAVSIAPALDDEAEAPVVASVANPPVPPTANPSSPTRKQLRSMPDFPMVTAAVTAPMQPPVVCAPMPIASNVPAPTVTAVSAAQEWPVRIDPAPSVKNPLETPVAFAAVLTPMNETPLVNTGEPFTPAAVPSQMAAAPEPADGLWNSLTLPTGDPSQPPAPPVLAQRSISPDAAPAGGDTQQSVGWSIKEQPNPQPPASHPLTSQQLADPQDKPPQLTLQAPQQPPDQPEISRAQPNQSQPNQSQPNQSQRDQQQAYQQPKPQPTPQQPADPQAKPPQFSQQPPNQQEINQSQPNQPQPNQQQPNQPQPAQQQAFQQQAVQQQSAVQQGDTPEAATRLIPVSPETKAKLAVHLDDNTLQAPVDAAGGAMHDQVFSTASFAAMPPADPADAAAPAQSSVPGAAPTPYDATAEALRTTESNLAAAPPSRTAPAQEIAIRIAPPDSPSVDLRVIERSGQVHVDVRTPDAAMQASLRQDLGTLTNSLERAGYHTETFAPASSPGRAASSAQAGNQDSRQDPSQNRGGSGDFSGGRRQQQPQKRPGTWLEEFEEQP